MNGIRPAGRGFCGQAGAALIVSLLMLVVILLLGVSAAQIALQGEKTGRNDRDRQLAFQAAEAALLDAEMDIGGSPDTAKSRSHLFSAAGVSGFTIGADTVCGSGAQNSWLGLCRHAMDGGVPAWQSVDFTDTALRTMRSVPYGWFTGQIFQTGNASLPVKTPRYIIELLPDRREGERVDSPRYLYRITAVGFGTRETSQVALQVVYRKAD